MNSRTTLQRLKAQLKAAGIRQQEVADAAGVHWTAVVHVLAGRGKSQNVVDTAHRLLERANGRKKQTRRRRVAVAGATT